MDVTLLKEWIEQELYSLRERIDDLEHKNQVDAVEAKELNIRIRDLELKVEQMASSMRHMNTTFSSVNETLSVWRKEISTMAVKIAVMETVTANLGNRINELADHTANVSDKVDRVLVEVAKVSGSNKPEKPWYLDPDKVKGYAIAIATAITMILTALNTQKLEKQITPSTPQIERKASNNYNQAGYSKAERSMDF